MRGNFISFLIVLTAALEARAVTVGASYDADAYYFYGSYNEVRTGTTDGGTFHVGQHILNTNPTYDRHFNFGAVVFNDLSSLSSESVKLLQLNVKNFKTPVSVDPSYQGPPIYSDLTTGNFRLALVALSADFQEVSSLGALGIPAWYNDKLYSRPRIAEVMITSNGAVQIDVTSTVNGWISNPSTNFGFGLIGLDSTPTATTVRFYSMESAGNLGPVLIPEPRSGALLATGLGVLLLFRRRVHS